MDYKKEGYTITNRAQIVNSRPFSQIVNGRPFSQSGKFIFINRNVGRSVLDAHTGREIAIFKDESRNLIFSSTSKNAIRKWFFKGIEISEENFDAGNNLIEPENLILKLNELGVEDLSSELKKEYGFE